MAIPINPLPDLSQYNYVIGDTVDVVTKQNAINAEIEALGQNINATVASINTDVQAVEDAEQNLDAAQIVHAPGSGLANEAGTAYSEDTATLLDRVNHTGTQTLATISDAGTAASSDVTTSATDTTAGRVMKTKDAGILSESGSDLPQLNDFFDDSAVGGVWYKYDDTTLNSPAGVGFAIKNYRGTIGGDKRATWIAYNCASIVPDVHSVTQVSFSGGDWKSWARYYHTANILGTVSQSNGVPTGAIIERGSNANGEYVKFADGTLICNSRELSTTTNTAFGGLYRSSGSDNDTWTFPSVFIGAPVVSLGSSNFVKFMMPHLSNETYISISGVSINNSDAVNGRVQAIGRWY